MVIAVKRVGAELELVEESTVYQDQLVKRFIGAECNVEVIMLDAEGLLCCGIDGDAVLKNLDTNFLLEVESAYWPIQKLAGSVVFFRIKSLALEEEIFDYEILSLKEEDVNLINDLLNEEYQELLSCKYMDYEIEEAVVFEAWC